MFNLQRTCFEGARKGEGFFYVASSLWSMRMFTAENTPAHQTDAGRCHIFLLKARMFRCGWAASQPILLRIATRTVCCPCCTVFCKAALWESCIWHALSESPAPIISISIVVQLVAAGVMEDVFGLCFGFPAGGTMTLGEAAACNHPMTTNLSTRPPVLYTCGLPGLSLWFWT